MNHLFRFSEEQFSQLPALPIIEEFFKTQFSSVGRGIRFEQSPECNGFSILLRSEDFLIKYHSPNHAYRACGELLSGRILNEGDVFLQNCSFDSLGVMLDVSRNGVFKLERIQSLFVTFALAGINSVQLYMEDTYELFDEPFFGYGRGAYTHAELKQIDDCGHLLGIEVIPCIQTLGHLEQILQWPAYREVGDVQGVMMVGNGRVYELIEKMLDMAVSCFRTRRIHIGMDEAHGVGSGRYLDKNGYRRPFDILNEHLEAVTELCRRRGLNPMMWSDMYFRIGSETHDYYDKEARIPDEVVGKVPRDVELVYWDYYHADPEFYNEWIQRHRAMGKEPIFAAGAWSWGRFWAFWPRLKESVLAGVSVARGSGVKEAFLTIWGDDGSECHPYSFLGGVTYFAECAYVGTPDPSALERRFSLFSPPTSFADCVLASEIDEIPLIKGEVESEANFAKWIFWHDPILGFLNRHIPKEAAEHYSLLSEKLIARCGKDDPLQFPAWIAKVLATKVRLHREVRPAYESADLETMRHLFSVVLPETIEALRKVWNLHREIWEYWYKPFGWEVLDRRYGGTVARLESLGLLLQRYLADPSVRIAEFEGERHAFYPDEQPSKFYFDSGRAITPSAQK